MVIKECIKSIGLIIKNPVIILPSIFLAIISSVLAIIANPIATAFIEKIFSIESLGSEGLIALPSQLMTFFSQEILIISIITLIGLIATLIANYWIALIAIQIIKKKKTGIMNSLSEAIKAVPQLIALAVFLVFLILAITMLFILAFSLISFNAVIALIVSLIILLIAIWLALNLLLIIPAMAFSKEKLNTAFHKSMAFFSKKPGQLIILLVIIVVFGIIINAIAGLINSFILIAIATSIISFIALLVIETFNGVLLAVYYAENK